MYISWPTVFEGDLKARFSIDVGETTSTSLELLHRADVESHTG